MTATKEQVLSAVTATEMLVPAPRTLSRALQLLRDTSSDLDEIATTISRDSALSVDVLRGANSAFYAQATRVTSIQQAVQVLGFRDALRILNIVATYQMAHRTLGSYGIAAEDYCTECLYSGFYMERLAILDGNQDPAECYAAGLLRLVGRLAVNQALVTVGRSAPWDGSKPLAEWELEHAGITQAEAGALLLRKWNFPANMVRAVEQQDQAKPAADADWLTLALNFTAHMLPAGMRHEQILALDRESLPYPADHPFVAMSGLSHEDADALRILALTELVKAREHFGKK